MIGPDGVERLYANAPIGLCYLDAELRFRYINEWLARMNGLPVGVHFGKTVDEVLKKGASNITAQLRHVLETGEAVLDGEVEAETPAHPGEPRCYQHSYTPDINKDGTVVGVSIIVQDVTAKKEAETALAERNRELETANEQLEKTKKQLQRLALYDTLTGLGNRNLFMRQIEHLIAIAERKNEEVALLEMDLDGFKDVNDRLGHAAGDEVLREFSVRLNQVLRKADRKYRIGGDEFAVLLEPRFGAFDGANIVAEKIAERVAAPMQIKGHSCSIGVSIGIAVFPEHGREPIALLRKADAAMYEAKKNHLVVAGASEQGATTVLKRLELDN